MSNEKVRYRLSEEAMQTDEAIEEIRRVRHEISEEFGHDTQALLKHYRSLEERYQHQMLRQERKRNLRRL